MGNLLSGKTKTDKKDYKRSIERECLSVTVVMRLGWAKKSGLIQALSS